MKNLCRESKAPSSEWIHFCFSYQVSILYLDTQVTFDYSLERDNPHLISAHSLKHILPLKILFTERRRWHYNVWWALSRIHSFYCFSNDKINQSNSPLQDLWLKADSNKTIPRDSSVAHVTAGNSTDSSRERDNMIVKRTSLSGVSLRENERREKRR